VVDECRCQIAILEFRIFVLIAKQDSVLLSLAHRVRKVGPQEEYALGIAKAIVTVCQQLPAIAKVKAVAQAD
jgi:hypothetical protein